MDGISLWHAREASQTDGQMTWLSEQVLLLFCSGAVQDAWTLRKLAADNKVLGRHFAGPQPSVCCFFVHCSQRAIFSRNCFPGTRRSTHPSHYRVNPNLIMIQDALASSDSLATISLDKYRTWKARPQHYFDGFAFYRIAKENVVPRPGAKERWKIAHGSLNLFWMLGLPTMLSAVPEDALGRTPGVILSDGAWRRDFNADPHIAGHIVHVGRNDVRVLGVAPAGAWRLPGNVDAWLLEADDANRGRRGLCHSPFDGAGQGRHVF